MKQFFISLLLCGLLLSCKQNAGTAPPGEFDFHKAAVLKVGKFVPVGEKELRAELNARVQHLVGSTDTINEVEITEIQVSGRTTKHPVLVAKAQQGGIAVAGLLVKKEDGLYYNTNTPMVICHGCEGGCEIFVIEVKGEPQVKCSECESCLKIEFFPY